MTRVTISSTISQLFYVQLISDPIQFSQRQTNLKTHLLNNIVCTLKIRLCSYKIVTNYLLSPFFYMSVIPFFLYFFCFSNTIMFNLNIASAIKKMPVNKLRDFIFENFHKRIGFVKKEFIIKWNVWKKRFFVPYKQINRKYTWPL